MNEIEFIALGEQLLDRPMPRHMGEIVERLAQHYPTISILAGCHIERDEFVLLADVAYCVFTPLLGDNQCISQEFHNKIELADGEVVSENETVYPARTQSLPESRKTWDWYVEHGYTVYCRNVNVA